MSDLLDGLKAVVRYRRKDGGDDWHTMAAFDVRSIAEGYAADCSTELSPWEYQVVDIINA